MLSYSPFLYNVRMYDIGMVFLIAWNPRLILETSSSKECVIGEKSTLFGFQDYCELRVMCGHSDNYRDVGVYVFANIVHPF